MSLTPRLTSHVSSCVAPSPGLKSIAAVQFHHRLPKRHLYHRLSARHLPLLQLTICTPSIFYNRHITLLRAIRLRRVMILTVVTTRQDKNKSAWTCMQGRGEREIVIMKGLKRGVKRDCTSDNDVERTELD